MGRRSWGKRVFLFRRKGACYKKSHLSLANKNASQWIVNTLKETAPWSRMTFPNFTSTRRAWL